MNNKLAPSAPLALALALHVLYFKHVAIFHDDIIHVHGLELVEILWERDEVDSGPFVKL